MANGMVTLSAEDRARLASFRQRAVSTRLGALPEGKSAPRRAFNMPRFSPKTKAFLKKPATEKPPLSIPVQPVSFAAPVEQENAPPAYNEVELSREDCFCAILDILLEGMKAADRSSKDAAKHLLIVMGNEAGSSLSPLVYNTYVRRYNALRSRYFLSAAANIKAKTIRISAEIVESLEQMAKTIQIELPPGFSLPPAR